MWVGIRMQGHGTGDVRFEKCHDMIDLNSIYPTQVTCML